MQNLNHYILNKRKKENCEASQKAMVTEFSLRVGNHLYPLADISRHSVSILRPNRWPGVGMISLGMLLGVLARFQAIPDYLYDSAKAITLSGYSFSKFDLVDGIAIALIAAGLLAFAFSQPRYALKITMWGTEEMNVIVSTKKEDVEKITDRLDEALKKKNRKATPKKKRSERVVLNTK